MSRNGTVEKIKNVIIVVLFLSAILLLYFSWGNTIHISGHKDAEIVTISASEVIEPSDVYVSQDGNAYIKVNSVPGYLDSAMAVISEYMSSGNIAVNTISREEYLVKKATPALILSFDYYLPFSTFCAAYGIAKPSNADNISNLSELVYSENDSKTLYVYNKNEQQYYMLSGSYEEGILSGMNDLIDTAISEAQTASENFIACYSLSDMIGEGSSSKVLVPLNLETGLKEVSYSKDFTPYDRDAITKYAKLFFGEGFDFVRKIEEKSGTITYMYGYGERTLIADANGYFEYKNTEAGHESVKYAQALDTAMSFAASHGGFTSLDGSEIDIYLASVSQNPGGNEGYRFEFGLRALDADVYYEISSPMIIDVIGGVVTYFRRDFINIDEERGEVISSYSAINMLAQNYLKIDEILNEKNSAKAKAKDLSAIADMVSDISFGLIKTESENKLSPAWIVSINNMQIAFDLYTAELITYSYK